MACCRGIARDEMYQRIGRAVAMSAAVGGAVAGVMAGVALAFPALIPLAAPLMMPLAVLGFCTVGVKIVRLGKGWYELYQGVPSASRPLLESHVQAAYTARTRDGVRIRRQQCVTKLRRAA